MATAWRNSRRATSGETNEIGTPAREIGDEEIGTRNWDTHFSGRRENWDSHLSRRQQVLEFLLRRRPHFSPASVLLPAAILDVLFLAIAGQEATRNWDTHFSGRRENWNSHLSRRQQALEFLLRRRPHFAGERCYCRRLFSTFVLGHRRGKQYPDQHAGKQYQCHEPVPQFRSTRGQVRLGQGREANCCGHRVGERTIRCPGAEVSIRTDLIDSTHHTAIVSFPRQFGQPIESLQRGGIFPVRDRYPGLLQRQSRRQLPVRSAGKLCALPPDALVRPSVAGPTRLAGFAPRGLAPTRLNA